MGTALMEGWVPLHSGAEVHLMHGLPDRVWMEGSMPPSGAELADEIFGVSGLHVRLGDWQTAAGELQFEAMVTVVREDLPEVLRRLAIASAEVYYDRYHKTMGPDDTDWDDEAYAQDFDMALHLCGLHWGEVDEAQLRNEYCEAMHRASDLITRH